MTHGSLYSGIGGWLLAAQWAGIENIFTCEIEDFPNKVLDKHFPNTDRHHDIKETDFTKYTGRIDILTTSDPCQPFSFAGKRGGKTDDRFLWPFTIEAIRTIKPAFVVFENVPGFISMAFETVASDLEAEGYTVESFIIPACALGAWHRRDRLWVIAYSNSIRTRTRSSEIQKENGEVRQRNNRSESCNSGKITSDSDNTRERTSRSGTNGNRQEEKQGQRNESQPESCGCSEDVANTKCKGLQRQSIGQMEESGEFTKGSKINANTDSQRGCSRDTGREDAEDVRQFTGSEKHGYWDIEPGLGGMVDRLPTELDYFETEPDIPRVTEGKKDRVNRLKALGNSIYPPIAYIIFEAIKQITSWQNQ